MSTVAVYNGFGGYETNDKGEKGITLTHGGVPFWFPFQGICYLPDFTMREVDHNASTADKEEESVLTYKTFVLKGQRIAEELLETQIPHPNSEKGFIIVQPTRADQEARRYAEVLSGYTEDGTKLYTEVLTFQPSEQDKDLAARKAAIYKETIVKEYFQSKRERMAGGKGQIFPTGLQRIFMDELGLKDIDDVSEQLKRASGTDSGTEKLVELLNQILQGARPVRPEPVEDKPAATVAAQKTPAPPAGRGRPAPAADLV